MPDQNETQAPQIVAPEQELIAITDLLRGVTEPLAKSQDVAHGAEPVFLDTDLG